VTDETPEERRERRRATWEARVCRSHEEANAAAARDYLVLTAGERFELVVRLSQELYGIDPDAPDDSAARRRRRSVVRVVRRSR
jgi:hypothetical protein